MKRLVLIFVALALAASFVGAQAATPAPSLVWSGNLYTGVDSQSINGATPTFKLWDPVNQTPSRFNFNAKYDAGSYGFFVRLREDDSFAYGNNGKIQVRRLYGWMDFLDGKIRVQAGRLGDFSWSTGSLGSNGWMMVGQVDGPVGMQLQLKPIPGLNFGAFLPFVQTTNTTPNLKADTNTPAAATLTTITEDNVPSKATIFTSAADAFSNMLFGGSYTVKGLGDVEVGYQLFAASGTAPAYTLPAAGFYPLLNNAPGQFPMFYFGLAYTGTPGLYACLESKIANTSTANSNFMYFDEKASYKMDALNFTLWGEENIWPSSAPNVAASMVMPQAGIQLHFKPIVDYTIGMVNVGAFVNFETSSGSGSNLMGYSGGPFIQLNTGKGTYMKLTGELGSGDLLPPAADTPVFGFPGYYPDPITTTQTPQWGINQGAGFLWQVNCSFVFSF